MGTQTLPLLHRHSLLNITSFAIIMVGPKRSRKRPQRLSPESLQVDDNEDSSAAVGMRSVRNRVPTPRFAPQSSTTQQRKPKRQKRKEPKKSTSRSPRKSKRVVKFSTPETSQVFLAMWYDRTPPELEVFDCDGCAMKILGERHHCTQCGDFDLCHECAPKLVPSHQHPKGSFEIIPPDQDDDDDDDDDDDESHNKDDAKSTA